MAYKHQKTICKPVALAGIGLHSGKGANMRMRPAPQNSGVLFKRVDLVGSDALIADFRAVPPSALQTVIERGLVKVATIEHLMAALSALEIDNIMIEIDGPEIPIVDGSAAPFIEMIRKSGSVEQSTPRRFARLTSDFTYTEGKSAAWLRPSDALEIDCTIEFCNPEIGRQSHSLRVQPETFAAEIAHARTFCLASEIEAMHEKGLALGGSTSNAMIFDVDGIRNPAVRRHRTDPVRHKILDLIGDVALLGAPLLAKIDIDRPGHGFTNRMLRAMAATPGLIA